MDRTEIISVAGLEVTGGLLLGAGVVFGDLVMAIAGGIVAVILTPLMVWAARAQNWRA